MNKLKTVQQIEDLMNDFLGEYEKYQTNPTKAGSKRMRNYLNKIKKLVTTAKRELLAADKGE